MSEGLREGPAGASRADSRAPDRPQGGVLVTHTCAFIKTHEIVLAVNITFQKYVFFSQFKKNV